ncbi:Phosphonates import ATP-binding protein PhnC 2 [Dissostichus eleginoides]|uniref:Phosphonates import ATP-binding protein PhnC 2 n=1 Tax=Dissostichus eleginoides TaxID=100907 RepID=A0AAD9BNQ2_DISEL|nr:Phosphonates import ATP-binding protein PhnC 2 [Dissostichus eleginoides]
MRQAVAAWGLDETQNAVKKDGRIDRTAGVCKKLVGHFSLTAGRPEVLLKKPRRNSICHHIPSYQNAKQDGVPGR